MSRSAHFAVYLACFFSLILSWSPVCRAHKVNLFAWVEQEQINVESSFSGGRKMINGSIKVRNQQTGKEILTGKTNVDGLFSFTLPKAVRDQALTLVITADSDDGHQASWILQPADYIQGYSSESADTLTTRAEIPVQVNSATEEPAACVSKSEIDELLESKLAPIRRNLASLSDPAPSFREITGAIGYLIGCAGIVAWMQSRRKK